MGVYIDMEMPKSCSWCFCMASCKLWKNIMSPEFNRHRNCPLVPVPPHGRLIDVDALKVSLAFAEETAEWAVPTLRAVLMVIDEMPTVIPASGEGEA